MFLPFSGLYTTIILFNQCHSPPYVLGAGLFQGVMCAAAFYFFSSPRTGTRRPSILSLWTTDDDFLFCLFEMCIVRGLWSTAQKGYWRIRFSGTRKADCLAISSMGTCFCLRGFSAILSFPSCYEHRRMKLRILFTRTGSLVTKTFFNTNTLIESRPLMASQWKRGKRDVTGCA